MSSPSEQPVPANLGGVDPVVATEQPAPLDGANLRRKTTRGALISTGAQGAALLLRLGSQMMLTRLLIPTEFGIVDIVTNFTGFLGLFRDAGLSMATVQRAVITSAQSSTLFWINVAVGLILGGIAAVGAPVLAHLYKEPHLLLITMVLGTSFIFNGASAQHRALLQREMKFGVLAIIDIVALAVSSGLGISLALAGKSYWALVSMNVTFPAAGLVGVWLASGWVPGLPQRGTGIRSMLHYGGTVTLNNVIVYFAYNADKILLSTMGPSVLGVYARAYRWINLPTENLNTMMGMVAFPALARLQQEPDRLRNYFLKGYRLFLSLVLPITMACALFAEDIIRFLCGPNWGTAAPVFRALAPTILTFALINPFAWLMLANGHAVRSLKIALMIAPLVILSYAVGLQYGALGVAVSFSTAMVVLVVPVIAWARRDTLVTFKDIGRSILPPLLSVLVGAAAALALRGVLNHIEPFLPRLVVSNVVLFGVYLLFLLFVMDQKSTYIQLLKDMGLWKSRGSNKQQPLT